MSAQQVGHVEEEASEERSMEAAAPTCIHWELYCQLSQRIALISFFLGSCLMFAVALILHSLFLTGIVEEYALGVYIVSGFVVFHISEFLVAVSVRRHDTHPSAFMLYNSGAYVAARLFAMGEFFLEWALIPDDWKVSKDSSLSWLLRLNYGNVTVFAVLAVAFYSVRVYGMLQCHTNFSLVIEVKRRAEHVLINHGIYSFLRHPAYFGFFWMSLCSQLLLLNPLSFTVYTIVLWRFFSERIRYEEQLLETEEFFGEKYKAYKSITCVGIPFIN